MYAYSLNNKVIFRYNPGPLHLLDNLVEDVFKDQKTNISKTSRIDQIITKDLSKSAIVSSHQKRWSEENPFFQLAFGLIMIKTNFHTSILYTKSVLS